MYPVLLSITTAKSLPTPFIVIAELVFSNSTEKLSSMGAAAFSSVSIPRAICPLFSSITASPQTSPRLLTAERLR